LKKKIYYWSPFLSPIATTKAVINSASSIMRYSKDYECTILNFFNEFCNFEKLILRKNIKIMNFYKINFSKYLPYRGKIKSRLSFVIFFILGFLPLKKILRNYKPDYLIIHLISSLPLVLFILFQFDTKLILRISGYPRMNYFRKILWKVAFKKIYLVTCPTVNTLNYLKKLDLNNKKKIKLLYDPIIDVNEINKKKNEIIDYKNYYLAVGRLTKQKNFLFLCETFSKLIEENKKLKLLIAGTGEEENKIRKYIKKNNLNNNIILLGHVSNIYPYFKNSNGFILSSLWEDPGFVIVEASFCRTPILSANSWPGPIELIVNNHNGILYDSNDKNSFYEKFKQLENLDDKKNMQLNNLKYIKRFTLFNHYKELSNIINK